MRNLKSLLALSIVLLAGLVPAQLSTPSLSKEEQLAAPCFRLSTEAEFTAAEKQVANTIQLPRRSADGPVWLQPGSKADFSDNPIRGGVHGISLRGAATYSNTQPGLLLKCVIRAGEKNVTEYVKYYVTTAPLNQIMKDGRGARDAAFVYFFIPDENQNDNIQSVDVTAISLGNGPRTKYVGHIDWNAG